MCVGHHYTQTSTNNVNKTRTLLQTTGDNDEHGLIQHKKNIKLIHRYGVLFTFRYCAGRMCIGVDSLWRFVLPI
jgi:hypothetical protein